MNAYECFLLSSCWNVHVFLFVQCMMLTTVLIRFVQEFHIDILPMDDGTPVLQSNIGLEFLETFESLVSEQSFKSSCGFLFCI